MCLTVPPTLEQWKAAALRQEHENRLLKLSQAEEIARLRAHEGAVAEWLQRKNNALQLRLNELEEQIALRQRIDQNRKQREEQNHRFDTDFIGQDPRNE